VLLELLFSKREKKRFSVAPLKEFCGENFREKKGKEKLEKKKTFLNFYLSFSFSSFSSSSITIVSLISATDCSKRLSSLYS
tara:strand:+ start:589 stop:831 length:243 start_codon:yes stop_codon:yes gene_type:complete